MALIAIELIRDSLSSSIDEDYVKSASRSYRAIFDVGDDELYVRTHCTLASGTLKPFSIHPTDRTLICTDLSVEADSDITTNELTGGPARLWRVTAKFGLWNPLEHSIDGNPTNIPTTYSFDGTNEQVPILIDINGNPIVNSAGDYYDPGLVRDRFRGTLHVYRNLPVVNPNTGAPTDIAFYVNLSNTVNRAAWPENAPTKFQPKTVKIAPVKIPVMVFSMAMNAYYLPMEFVFEINPDTWVKQVLNQGYRELDNARQLRNIYVNGQLATQPVPLDINGHALLTPTYLNINQDTPPTGLDPELGGGQPPLGGSGDATGAGLYFNAFDVYQLQDFTVLGMQNLFNPPPVL